MTVCSSMPCDVEVFKATDLSGVSHVEWLFDIAVCRLKSN
jgi:hypothetical protein